MPRTVAILQARTGSRRLPRKSLALVLGRPLLDLMLERVMLALTLDEVVLATTTLARDDALVEVAERRGVNVFRGSEADVLGRYVGAARLARAEVVVRLTADCPLLDPEVIDRVVVAHRRRDPRVDFVTNAPPQARTYPDGMDVEVFTTEVLARVDYMATGEDREHVTSRLHRAPFRREIVDCEEPVGNVRVTVDETPDLIRVRAIFEALYPADPEFGLSEILTWITAQK